MCFGSPIDSDRQQGSAGVIILVAITAVIGVIALAGALEGYLFRRARWWERVLLGAGGLVLMAPGPWYLDILGITLIALPVTTQYIAMKLSPPVPAAELAESSPLDSLSGPKEPFLGPME